MSYLLSVLLVALTALTWLVVVTLAPDAERVAEPLREVATLLTALSLARIAELAFGRLIEGRGDRKATDLVRVMSSIIIYLAALVAFFYFGLGFNITGLLATSAIVTIVIGLALQTTLGNLFAGMSIELERPVHVGDYLRRSPIEGQVEALKWRSIFLRAGNGALVVMPNNTLATNAAEIVPQGSVISHTVPFHVPPFYPPMMVEQLILEALASGTVHAGVLKDPAPRALMLATEPEGGAIRYGARFYTTRPGDLTTISSAVLTRLWYVLGRSGIAMSSIQEDDSTVRLHVPGAFRFQPPAVPPALVAAGRILRFGPGEVIPADVPGLLAHGLVQEDVLDEEFDLGAALAALDAPVDGRPAGGRLGASAQAEIAKQAMPFLGPLATALVANCAAVTDDPFVVYHAIARRISAEKDRAKFLSAAPTRPVRRLGPGEEVGFAGILGLEPAGARRRTVPAEATLVAFSRECLAELLAEPETGDALVRLLAASRSLRAETPADLRARLERLAG